MLLLAELIEGVLRQREAYESRLQLGDRDQRGVVVRVDEVTLVDQPRAEASVDRRANVGIAEIEGRVVDLRLIASDRCLQLGDERGLIVVALPGLIAGAKQF